MSWFVATIILLGMSVARSQAAPASVRPEMDLDQRLNSSVVNTVSVETLLPALARVSDDVHLRNGD